MHIRELVKKTWQEAGLYHSQDQRLRAFLEYFDQHPELCWDDVIRKVRANYSELVNTLVPPLWDIDDKLLHLTLIRKADLSRSKELRLLTDYAKKADPGKNGLELSVLAQLKNKKLNVALCSRHDLPGEVFRLLGQGILYRATI